LDELLKEEQVMDVIGCLEYDPDLQTPQQHRQFLSTAVVFKEVVPITSQDVLSKIHQTYRIQYLKDVILPRRYGAVAGWVSGHPFWQHNFGSMGRRCFDG
jgi:protein phosphatase-4 regulatory subunit 3